MNKNVIAIAGLMFLFCFGVIAQENATYENLGEENLSYEDWKNNWYVEVGGGAQLLFSSDASNLDLKERLTPSMSFTIGKWFSPSLGIRLQANGYSLNGFNTPGGISYPNLTPIDPATASSRYYLRYVNTHIDMQTSLFNLFCGYNPERRFDIIPAIGIGYFRTLEYKGTPATHNISNNLSLMFKYSINKKFDINLEAHGAVLPGSFDGRITKDMYEGNTGLNLGITYNFGSKPRQVEVIYSTDIEIVKDTVLLEKIVEKEKIKEVIKKEKRDPFVLASIRFDLAKSVPLTKQETTFVNVVNYLEANPNAKIRLDGYGDKGTGSARANLMVSIKRTDNVRKLLIGKYGVNPKRIETQGVGSENQPYQKNDWNRVVVITVIEE